ncbi:MAG: hypothetical protein KAH21_10785 [Spirochaetaceae bacterium]|nr:hypothetical protein [Spirochaetaceae bacterium]
MKYFQQIIEITAFLLFYLFFNVSSLMAESPEPDPGNTVYGFFPSPVEISIESIFSLYKIMGEHADVVMYQQAIPWENFTDSQNINSREFNDLKNQLTLAQNEGLEGIFVIDPLNGLNRREFQNLPPGWEASFGNPKVRSAIKNFTLRIVQEFQPRYLGLASEINTYADAYPEDFQNYLSLYREVYTAVKTVSPETKIFVTFQWEDLNNLWPQPWERDYSPGEIKWQQIEVFEPQLDLWAISSYPYIAFNNASEIPEDYYLPLLTRTDKNLAVSEGGWISEDFEHLTATDDDQIGYINAINQQIGNRMAFWIYLLAQDINIESYSPYINGKDLETLGFFKTVGLISRDGIPKPALSFWDQIQYLRTKGD